MPNPKPQHTPTPGALRAARAILSELDPTACTQFDYENDVQGLAGLIETETGLPELLAALSDLFKHCAMVHRHWGEGSNQKESDAAIAAARAALAKAGVAE